MIRVLQIGLGPNAGGIESCIINYYKHINHTQFAFDFVDIYGKGLAHEDVIKQYGGTIYSLPDYKTHVFGMINSLKKIFRENSYDIVHINLLSAANLLLVKVVCNSTDAKVVVHSHNSDVPKGLLRRILNRMNMGQLRKMPTEHWACGEKAGVWMWGENFTADHIIINAVDKQLYEKKSAVRARLRNQCNFTEKNTVVGFVGRLSEQKNVLFLADILNELCKISRDYKLLIIGDGELGDCLHDRLRGYNISDNVYFAGIRDDVSEWYQVMDVFVLPSLFEGLPLVGIEAQAAKLPCFVSNRIARELNITNTVSFLPIDNAVVWADAIHAYTSSDSENRHEFPMMYDICTAVHLLEERYRLLVPKEISCRTQG